MKRLFTEPNQGGGENCLGLSTLTRYVIFATSCRRASAEKLSGIVYANLLRHTRLQVS